MKLCIGPRISIFSGWTWKQHCMCL